MATLLLTRFADSLPGAGIDPANPRPVIVGLSGGADSVALCELLVRVGVNVVAAHANFSLRGQESERDQAAAQAVAARLGVPFRVAQLGVDPNGSGIEAECRRLRYEWFESLASELDAQAIAVGHHRRDQAETLLLNLLDRRSGIAGLRAMKPRNGLIARPLLDFDAEELRRWLISEGITWVEDSSNSSLNFRRNVMRHRVLPALEAAMPEGRSAVGSLAASAAHLLDDERLLNALSESALARNRRNGDISLSGLVKELGAAPSVSLLARTETLNRVDAANAVEALSRGRNGLQFGPYALHDGWLILPSPTPEIPLHSASIVAEFTPHEGPDAAWFDADAWRASGLEPQWRVPERGERFKTFGLRGRGSRLVSDLLKEAGIPANRRSTFMMLCLGEEPVWLPGVANSVVFPVTKSTVNILKYKLLK